MIQENVNGCLQKCTAKQPAGKLSEKQFFHRDCTAALTFKEWIKSISGLRHISFRLYDSHLTYMCCDSQWIICMTGFSQVSQTSTSICTSNCSFWVKPLTPFPAEAWPIKVMTLISGAWQFNIAAISCTLSRNDEKIITRVLTSCAPQSGNASEKLGRAFLEDYNLQIISRI